VCRGVDEIVGRQGSQTAWRVETSVVRVSETDVVVLEERDGREMSLLRRRRMRQTTADRQTFTRGQGWNGLLALALRLHTHDKTSPLSLAP
jgi:hypothetical protein